MQGDAAVACTHALEGCGVLVQHVEVGVGEARLLEGGSSRLKDGERWHCVHAHAASEAARLRHGTQRAEGEA